MANKIFFIIGRARSGTTLVKALLDAHPNVIVPVECAFLLNLYLKYGKKTRWDAALMKSFSEDLVREPAYKLMNIDEAKLENKLNACLGVNSYATVCMQVYESCVSFYPKQEIKLWGDKNPAYSLYIKQLREIYPDAKFVYIVRDYRDHIVSMMRVDYEAHIVSSLAYRWKYYDRQVQREREKDPSSFYSFRYEDFVKDTPRYLQEICSFLGIPYDEQMLKFQEKKDAYYDNYPKDVFVKYHKSIFDPIDSSKTGTWENKLSERKIRIAEAVAGAYGEKLGYKRTFQKEKFWFVLFTLPGIAYGRLFFTWVAFVNFLPYKMRMAIVYLLAMVFKPYWKRYEKKRVEGSRQ